MSQGLGMQVLIAEDDSVSRKILTRCLERWGHTVVPTTDGQEAWDLLQQPDAPRFVILDWVMPHMDGMQVCTRLREDTSRPLTYVIMLTARGRKEDIVNALDSGADDYLIKPYDSEELQSRIGAGMRILELSQQLEKANEKLQEMAQTDFLTKIPNRSAIMSQLESEMARARRDGTPLAVVMGDVDHFKRVNDEHGHVAGDTILITVAQRLKDVCRRYDLVGRYGGEEFMMTMPGVTLYRLDDIMERLRQHIISEPVEVDGESLPITMSMGAIWIPPDASPTMEEAIKAADELLYHAKESGRDRFCVAEWETAKT